MKKAILLLLAMSVVFTQSLSAAVINGTDSLTGTESTMSPRFFRSGTPGDACATFSSGNFQYKTYDFNSDGTGQLTVDFDPGACGTGIFVTFHEGTFNPASICDNYLWAYGSSQAFTETFTVPTNTAITMVVSGVANAPGVVCGPYTWQIDGVSVPVVALTIVPTMTEWGIMILSLLLGATAIFYLRRQKGSAC